MQEIKKITLHPTRSIKKHSPEAIGSLLFDQGGEKISLNLFNLPEPSLFSTEDQECDCYKSWLYNPTSGQILALDTLTPSRDGLYIRYDLPIEFREGFSEILITAEQESSNQPTQEILLIGYLFNQTDQPLERFEPFSPSLTNHKWWKVKNIEKEDSVQRSPRTCHQCPNWQQFCYRPMYSTPGRRGFDLPYILGLATNNAGEVQYMVHGIPGRFLRAEQPDQGRTGYLHWQPYYGIEEKVGAMGYWLCYIDPKTNQTATPYGVTMPPG